MTFLSRKEDHKKDGKTYQISDHCRSWCRWSLSNPWNRNKYLLSLVYYYKANINLFWINMQNYMILPTLWTWPLIFLRSPRRVNYYCNNKSFYTVFLVNICHSFGEQNEYRPNNDIWYLIFDIDTKYLYSPNFSFWQIDYIAIIPNSKITVTKIV